MLKCVVFSDGAPSAGRFLFSDTSVVSTNVDTTVTGLGPYDYDIYTVAWLRRPPIPAGEASYYSGPSLMVDNSALRSPIDGEFGIIMDDPAELPNPPGARCHNGRNRAYPVSAPAALQDSLENNFSGCLTSFQAHLPGDTNSTYGSQYSPTASTARFRDWRKQYYHCAIEMGDFIRSSGNGTIYGIGLGDVKAGVAATDPYQDIEDDTNRKDIFLSRVMMDVEESGKYQVADANGNLHRLDFDYLEYKDFSEASQDGKRREGVYLPTSDPTQLRLLFQHIARRILLKVVE